MRLTLCCTLSQEFAEAAVTAYECGYAEDTLRQDLEQATEQPGTAENIKVKLYQGVTCLDRLLQLRELLSSFVRAYAYAAIAIAWMLIAVHT